MYVHNEFLAFAEGEPRELVMDKDFFAILGVHQARIYYNMKGAISWPSKFPTYPDCRNLQKPAEESTLC